MTPPKFRRENRGTARKPNYRVVYYVNGERHREPTGARTLVAYDAYVQQLARKFLLGTWTPPGERAEGLTFEAWAPQAIAKRVELGVRTAAKDEAAMVRNHLVPEFGKLTLDEIADSLPRVVEGFARIAERVSAGGTVRNIYIVFVAVMRLAAKTGHIKRPPPALSARDGELPHVVSTRPDGWRAAAKFTREEIATLLSCEEIEMQSRVMYAAYFLTGCRCAELLTVRWRDWNRDRVPMTSLTLSAVKTQRGKGQLYRQVPVHPTLAAWLSWWHREGFELVHLREPQPHDLMFPTQSHGSREEQCTRGEVYGRWMRRHLPAAGLRHRRLHDSRGTFISIVRSAGAQSDIVRAITHRAVTDKVLDEGYTVWEWEAVCKAVSGVDWRLPGPPSSTAVVVPLRARKREA